jgi:hypothetical protein
MFGRLFCWDIPGYTRPAGHLSAQGEKRAKKSIAKQKAHPGETEMRSGIIENLDV